MWSLKIIKGAELADKLVPELRLPQPLQRFTIGRNPGNSWPIADRTLAISGRHCEIVHTRAGPALRDLSTNGTFVNGATTRLLGEHALCDGDRIEIGPFVIGVSGPPPEPQTFARTALSPAAPTSAAPAHGPAVPNAAPLRGGDPAAMAAVAAIGSASGAVGLTEILRVAAPSDHSDADLTKIRLAPAPAPAPALSVAATSGAAAVTPAAPPASTAPSVPAGVLTEALARGLGLPVSALQGHDTLLLVQQLALTARAATAAVRQLIEHQAQARRTLGALRPGPALASDDNPMRTAANVDAAVLALRVAIADPVTVMQRSANELCAHDDHLLQALVSASSHPPR